MTAIGSDNIQSLDTSLTALIAGDLALAQTLQAAIQAIAASATSKPTYTISGPTGSQTVDWQTMILNLTHQLEPIAARIERWFKLKQTNLPYFNIRNGR